MQLVTRRKVGSRQRQRQKQKQEQEQKIEVVRTRLQQVNNLHGRGLTSRLLLNLRRPGLLRLRQTKQVKEAEHHHHRHQRLYREYRLRRRRSQQHCAAGRQTETRLLGICRMAGRGNRCRLLRSLGGSRARHLVWRSSMRRRQRPLTAEAWALATRAARTAALSAATHRYNA